jgi:hypothetical protein
VLIAIKDSHDEIFARLDDSEPAAVPPRER